jgi:hypothetical protein
MRIIFKNLELFFWIAALLALRFSDPSQPTQFTLCPFRLAGISWCPGCGIGHAIAYLLHGNIRSSFHTHWLGIPALAVLLYRIYALINPRSYNFN